MRRYLLTLLILPAFAVAQVEGNAGPPLRMVIPTEKDRGLDIIARLVQPSLAKQFGEPIRLDNRPGKDGFVGVEFAAKAPPNQPVVLIAALHSLVVNPIHWRLPFDARQEFTPVAL